VWIPVVTGIAVHAFIAGVVYGALSQKVREHENRMNRSDGWQLEAATLMRHFAERVAYIEGSKGPHGKGMGHA
jgi:hypothetical protein